MKSLVIIMAVISCSFTIMPVRLAGQIAVSGHIRAEVMEGIMAGGSSPMNVELCSADIQNAVTVIPATGSAHSPFDGIKADGNVNPSTFSVSGSKNAAFAVSLPVGPTTLTNIFGDNTVTVTSWTATSGAGGDAYLLSGGVGTVKVGATLQVSHVNENPKGVFVGSYKVTFAYN